MKKWIKKHGDKTFLILLTVIGLIFIVGTYIMSFYNGRSGENLGEFNFSEFGSTYSAYCINTLILYSYVKIKRLQQYKIQRKSQRLSKINQITLPSNSIPESVEINMDCRYIRYDLFYDKYNSKIKQIVVLNIVVYVVGMVPYICYHASKANWIIFMSQVLVGIFNIEYIVLGELERSEINFLSIKLSSKIKSCEKNINETYEKYQTFHIQREFIEIYERQPYYVIQYSKLNNKYRMICNLIIVFIIICIVALICVSGDNLGHICVGKNGILYTIYPNVISMILCMVSNWSYYQKIDQHKVSIEECIPGKETEHRKLEINKLIYTINIGDNKKREKNKLYIISIMDMLKEESILGRFKK